MTSDGAVLSIAAWTRFFGKSAPPLRPILTEPDAPASQDLGNNILYGDIEIKKGNNFNEH